MQIRGGRGYETAESLQGRGEPAVPVERFLRDSRINTIFEGSSEIMRLFIAREMLDPHLKIIAPVLNSHLPWPQRLRLLAKAAWFYLTWYAKQWLPIASTLNLRPSTFNPHLRYAARTSRRLARAIFYAMIRHGQKLEREQLLLGRFVDIGAELFAITAACLHAGQLLQVGDEGAESERLPELVDYFCRSARLRIEEKFRQIQTNTDRSGFQLSQQVLADK
jgi:Acyl-CoA dehydrogenase, C-terminal domain/ACAD9/ACADV, C-terminal domain